MPEAPPLPLDEQLASDLAAYFAATTSTQLPAAVRTLSSATLRRRPLPWTRRLGVPGLALAGAAAVVIGGVAVARSPHGSGAGTASSALSVAGAGTSAGADGGYRSGPDVQVPASAVPTSLATGMLLDYPGVDSTVVEAAMNIRLLSPAGHGAAAVSPAAARAAAVAAAGPGSSAQPAVLAWVDVPGLPAPNSCLCWVVEVVLPAGGSAAPDLRYAPASTHSALLLIDAATARVFAAVFGPGIP